MGGVLVDRNARDLNDLANALLFGVLVAVGVAQAVG